MSSPRDLVGYSRGMYSNWIWHRPLQLLVDAGEGLQLALGTSVYQPSWLAITHGHSDHVLGLPGLLAARRFGKGAQDKPLTVVYPDGSRGVAAARSFLDTAYAGVRFPVTWVPVTAGAAVPLANGRTLEAFEVTHTPHERALGYRVVEMRRRLTAAFAGWPQADIERHARAGHRDEMMESVRHIVFAHSGDAMPVAPGEVHGADLLVHDGTFLDAADRREPIHASTREALDVAAKAGAAALVLHHLSIRYDRASAVPALGRQVAESGFRGRVWLLDENRWMELPNQAALTSGRDVPGSFDRSTS